MNFIQSPVPLPTCRSQIEYYSTHFCPVYSTWDCATPQYPINCPVVSTRPQIKCLRWSCPTVEVDPIQPIDPIQQDHHVLYVGLGVAAAAILFVVFCGILVIIQNWTNTTYNRTTIKVDFDHLNTGQIRHSNVD